MFGIRDLESWRDSAVNPCRAVKDNFSRQLEPQLQPPIANLLSNTTTAMALDSTALTTKVTEGSPYQLDVNQVQRAADALLKHIKKTRSELDEKSTKQSLLPHGSTSSDDEEASSEEKEPVWLIVTTKKHIVDKKRLKPNKMFVLIRLCFSSPCKDSLRLLSTLR